MKSMVAWFARNSVAANLLMILLVLGGVTAATQVKIEMFPEFSLDLVTVTVPHPGASPEEVEEGICVKIEEEVHSIDGVKKVRSAASEGVGTVFVEIKAGEDPRRVLDDVKTRVDAIDTFPEDAESPVIQEMLARNQVINVAVYGDASERTLKEYGKKVRDELNALPGITQVDLVSSRPYEISIEVSERELRRHGLTFDEVARAIRSSSLDLSGGSIKTVRGEILLRTDSQAETGDEFSELLLKSRADGSRVLLGDVATVVDGFADTDQSSRFEGKPAVMVQVYRTGDESALAVAAITKEYVERARVEAPREIGIAAWQDQSVWLRERMDLLVKNGLQGLCLVFVILALFLRFRLSFWATLGIPISFLGVLFVMPGLDQSVNMLSLFAFILVLGIVVDDAIVVAESVHREQESGHRGVEGAVRGVKSVAIPVVFAVLTTVVAFVPMIFLPGIIGKFFAVIPMAVIPALVFSLIESQLVLPAHLSHEGGLASKLARIAPFRWWVAVQERFSAGLQRVADRHYQPLLERAVEWRYLTIAIALSSLLLMAGIVRGGFVKYLFFPDIESDVIAVQLTMPQGTSARTTALAVQQVENAARALTDELETETGGQDLVRYFMASVGEQPFYTAQTQTQGGLTRIGSHYGEVVIELISAEEREITSTEITDRWRELCGPIPGALEADFSSAVMTAGAPIDIQLSGDDTEQLRRASERLKSEVARFDGVFDVKDSFRGGKQELVLDVLPAAEAFGITRMDLARQVRQGFYGEEVQRIQRGRDDVKVMLRYPAADRESLAGIESMRVRGAGGIQVPFRKVAEVSEQEGFSTIERTDRRRKVSVTADVDVAVATPSDILASLEETVFPELVAEFPGVTPSLTGQSTDQAEFQQKMGSMYLLALFVIYALMAIPFKSYLQPLIVTSAIPFGIVGALAGHMIMGIDLSSISILGLAALAGVVVNDSLVLVDYVNQKRAEGLPITEAARTAGRARFRPIILTSLTTFAGLSPLMFEKSVQAQFLVPMAVALAFGVMFSTLISLLFVPSAYVVLEDLRRGWNWLYGPREEASAGGAGSLAAHQKH